MNLYNPELVHFSGEDEQFTQRSKQLVTSLTQGAPLTRLVDGGGFYYGVYQTDDYPDLVVKRLKTATVPSYFTSPVTLGQIWVHLMHEHDIVYSNLPSHTPRTLFARVSRPLIDCTDEEIECTGTNHFAYGQEYVAIQQNIADARDLRWGDVTPMLDDGFCPESFFLRIPLWLLQSE